MPHGEHASDHGARQENLAVGEHVVIRLLRKRVDFLDRRRLALALELERGKRKPRARDDLEQIGPGAQHVGEVLGQLEVLADVRLQPADAVRADHEPDL